MKVGGGHESTIHVGYGGRNRLLSLYCTTCQQTFVFWAGLFETPSNVKGSVAYRIPDLEYLFSLPNGVAIIVKDSRIVGRIVWATGVRGVLGVQRGHMLAWACHQGRRGSSDVDRPAAGPACAHAYPPLLVPPRGPRSPHSEPSTRAQLCLRCC
ncbi:uncharacterized protein K452DRAFT_293381 [Aplosporella prunicola CBS 121167]|uniref:Uncharacterized protein n=1 Tax=Aplosporella prunicola CBS 121167 TaxID=1176127 RepID=A0A6A6AVI0_9PEZI|nr:uncharacterized protein K452DRAFT_293381 [Aplosporella prunicola CBS 121167]KAF2135228.1 hypothetical protein K452DRAFT_293381 [Aplosporella prunicola CBS 121167]